MLGIHVNWTKPKLENSKINYFYNSTKEDNSFTFTKFTTILSALWWKHLNGPIKLYTDSAGLKLYRKHNLHLLYDSIDTDLLDNYNGNPKLWTAGKIFSIAVEKPPFCFLDNDLILTSTLEKTSLTKDVGFTHWELPRGSEYEIKQEYFENQILRSNLNLDFNQLVTNTSFFYVNCSKFQKLLLDEHYLNYQIPSEEINTQVWMYTDQIIPGQIIRNIGSSYFTLDTRIHIPYSTEMTNELKEASQKEFNSNERLTEIPTWVSSDKYLGINYKYQHIWVYKAEIVKNEKFFKEFISNFKKEIKTFFPEMYFLCK